MRIILILWTASIGIPFSFAAPCANISKLSCLENYPELKQGTDGTCWGYATGIAVTCALRKEGLISPGDVSDINSLMAQAKVADAKSYPKRTLDNLKGQDISDPLGSGILQYALTTVLNTKAGICISNKEKRLNCSDEKMSAFFHDSYHESVRYVQENPDRFTVNCPREILLNATQKQRTQLETIFKLNEFLCKKNQCDEKIYPKLHYESKLSRDADRFEENVATSLTNGWPVPVLLRTDQKDINHFVVISGSKSVPDPNNKNQNKCMIYVNDSANSSKWINLKDFKKNLIEINLLSTTKDKKPTENSPDFVRATDSSKEEIRVEGGLCRVICSKNGKQIGAFSGYSSSSEDLQRCKEKTSELCHQLEGSHEPIRSDEINPNALYKKPSEPLLNVEVPSSLPAPNWNFSGSVCTLPCENTPAAGISTRWGCWNKCRQVCGSEKCGPKPQ